MDFLTNFDFGGLASNIAQGATRFGGALLYLILFLIAAVIVRWVIRRVLGRLKIDNQIAEMLGGDSSWPVERVIGQIAFYIIVLLGITAFLNQIQLDAVTEPLNALTTTLMNALPNIGYALVLLILAYFIARVVRDLILRGADALELDNRLASLDAEGTQQSSVGASLATAGYWLVFLLFLPPILSALGMTSLVSPLNNMLGDFLGAIPNILKAGLVLLIGMFVARIVRQIAEGFMGAFNVDRFAKGANLNFSIKSFIGTLVYTVILLLTIVQALDTLAIEAVSGPATAMINQIFAAVPNFIGAGLLIVISLVVARLVAQLVMNLLESANFDSIPSRLGVNLSMETSPTKMVGWIIVAGTMLLAAIPASEMLGFPALTGIIGTFIDFAGQILVGIIVLGIGLYLANLARDVMESTGSSAFAASIVRAAILVLVTGMALQAIGIGEDIVQLAFGIGLGAIGIAAALAFGLGSRDIAGREVERFVSDVRSQSDE